MSDADKVRAAADYIEKRGLNRGDYYESHGTPRDPLFMEPDFKKKVTGAVERGEKCCTLGALIGFGLSSDSEEAVSHKFYQWAIQPTGELGFAGWNDDPERTQDEIVTALRAFSDTLDVAT